MAAEKTEKVKNVKAVAPKTLRNGLTLFQLITSAVAVYSTQPEYRVNVLSIFGLLIVVEWVSCFVFAKYWAERILSWKRLLFSFPAWGLRR